MTIDTLALARELRGAELSGAQAEAIAAAIGRALTEIADARIESGNFKLEMKGEFAALDQKLEAIEQRLGNRIEAMRSSLLVWLIGVILAGAGLFVTLAKLHLG